jgi:glycosyltransferase involved in cell wall biosynthesis
VRWIETRALRGAAAVVAVSDGVAEAVREMAPETRIEVVGHGVDPRSFHAGVRPLEPELDAVYVGTASEWHGAGVFAAALRILDERGIHPRVAFVGQGSDWDQLREELGGLPGVTFGPSVDADTAARRLRGARVALASLKPSVGYDFAVPTKMYSALAVGTPVVLSAPARLHSLVEANGLGWACSEDPEEIAGAMQRAIADSPSTERRAGIAEWARSNVSAPAVAVRVIDLLQDVVAASSNPRSGAESTAG